MPSEERRPRRRRPRRHADAAHEAAHAVASEALGVEVDTVVLCADVREPYGVCTTYRQPPSRLLHDALGSAAGPAADVLVGAAPAYATRRVPAVWRADYADMRKMGYSRAERELLVRLAVELLRGPLRAAWEAVTAALLERDLTGAEVRELIATAGATVPPKRRALRGRRQSRP